MKILFFLFPFAGHIYPNIELIEHLNKNNELVCVSDKKYEDVFDSREVKVLNYPSCVSALYGGGTLKGVESATQKRIYYRNDYDCETIKKNGEAIVTISKIIYNELWDEILEFNPNLIIGDSYAIWSEYFADKLGVRFIGLELATYMSNHELDIIYKDYLCEVVENEIGELLDVNHIIEQQNRVKKKINKKLDGVFQTNHSMNPNSKFLAYMCPKLQIGNELLPKGYDYMGFNMKMERLEKKNIIYVTRGTITDEVNHEILLEQLDALGTLEYKVIGSLGNKKFDEEKAQKSELFGPRITLESYVEQKKVLAESSVMITHGGITGVREAIFNETPLIIFPMTYHCYQVGRAIEKNHAGILLHKHPFSKEEFLSAVNRIFEDKSYKEEIIELKQDLLFFYNKNGKFEEQIHGIDCEC